MSKSVKVFFIALILIAMTLIFGSVLTDQTLNLSVKLAQLGALILLFLIAGSFFMMVWKALDD